VTRPSPGERTDAIPERLLTRQNGTVTRELATIARFRRPAGDVAQQHFPNGPDWREDLTMTVRVEIVAGVGSGVATRGPESRSPAVMT
jgi:hypothetical protein